MLTSLYSGLGSSRGRETGTVLKDCPLEPSAISTSAGEGDATLNLIGPLVLGFEICARRRFDWSILYLAVEYGDSDEESVTRARRRSIRLV